MTRKPSLTERIRQIPPCLYCKENEGRWRKTENGTLERCDCARGVLLRLAEQSGCRRGGAAPFLVSRLRIGSKKGSRT